jgi:MerR family transcriptional regulator, light-induced transcriptional regulator
MDGNREHADACGVLAPRNAGKWVETAPMRPPPKGAHSRARTLDDIIANVIVPKLQSLHSAGPRQAGVRTPSEEDVFAFGAVAISRDPEAATAFFERMRAKGHSIETLFDFLLAPAARHLGELWEQDRVDFIDVTLGVARMHELLGRLRVEGEDGVEKGRHVALLVSTPREKHRFGVEMVSKLMRGAGWLVTLRHELEPPDVAHVLAESWFSVFGVTLSAESGAESVARMIVEARAASFNRNLSVMVGGPAFVKDPALAAQVGADAAAPDASTAVVLAKTLLLRQAA